MTGRGLVLLFVGSALLASSGCKRPPSPGELIYRERCAECHGLDGAGNTPKAIGYAAADLLADSSTYDRDPVGLERTIRSGVPGRMPANDQLSDEEMRVLLTYIRYLRGEALSPE